MLMSVSLTPGRQGWGVMEVLLSGLRKNARVCERERKRESERERREREESTGFAIIMHLQEMCRKVSSSEKVIVYQMRERKRKRERELPSSVSICFVLVF